MGINWMKRFFRRDITRLESKPALFQWRWTDIEWAALVSAARMRFDWSWALTRSAGAGLGGLVLGWLWRWYQEGAFRVLASDALAGPFFACMMLLIFGIGYFMRTAGVLLPRLGDSPVCFITQEGVRLGDKVLWFRGLGRNIVRIQATTHSNLGEVIAFTQRHHLQGGQVVDVPIFVPVPRAHPDLAAQVVNTLALMLDYKADPVEKNSFTREFAS